MDPVRSHLPASSNPAPARGRAQSRHDRAERLLITLATCASAARRGELEQDIVVLTSDIADHAARRYRGRGVELEDLQQVALCGLFLAVRRFKPERGRCFAAYAQPTVTGELKRHFRDLGWVVRPPRRLQELGVAARRRQEQLRSELLREPTPEELATSLQVGARELDAALVAGSSFRTVSLDGGQSENHHDDPFELPDGHDAYAEVDTREALGRALRSVATRELEILRLRFVEDRTQAEIGKEFGISQMQVSRLLATTLGQLRTALEAAA